MQEIENKPVNWDGRVKRSIVIFGIFILCALTAVGQLIIIDRVKTRDQDFMINMEQLRSYEITAKRGAIYDSDKNVLALSVQGWDVSFNYDTAKTIREKVYNALNALNDAQQKDRAEKQEILDKAQESWDDFYKLVTVDIFSDLGIDEETGARVRARLDEIDTFFASSPTKTQINAFPEGKPVVVTAVSNISLEEKTAVDRHIKAYNEAKKMYTDADGNQEERDKHSSKASGFIRYDESFNRIYNYSDIVANIVGLVNKREGNGIEGLELQYNDELSGTNGMRLLRTSGQRENDAVNGVNLVTTINIPLQTIMRDILAQAKDETDADTAVGICMDVETGAVLADVSLPDFDSTDISVIKDSDFLADFLENSTALEQPVTGVADGALVTLDRNFYQTYQRVNRSVAGSYELGSVVKVITTAAALEENLYEPDKEVFTCNGSISFPGERDDEINCWAGAQGPEDIAHLLINSCNPFAAYTAYKLGRDKFYDYFEAFGLTERTGIDFPGESWGNIPSRTTFLTDKRYMASLFSYSYGQSFMISPLQMVTAVSAVANGGRLMKPYLVQQMIDDNGNVLSVTKPEVRRQVISESTSDLMRDYMTRVVTDPNGTGKNAAVTGYNIAGKTGTAEHTEPLAEYGINDDGNKTLLEYNAVFCGFAPSDNPKIAVIFILDYPKYGHSAAKLAAPLASLFFEKALEYLGIPKTNTDSGNSYNKRVPDITGKSIEEARSVLYDAGLNIYTVGQGASVDKQYPAAGALVSEDGVVAAYSDDSATKMTMVPDFKGCSVREAINLASESDINISLEGNISQSYDSVAYGQSVDAETRAQVGDVVKVYFMSNAELNN
ncbi:MAG: PASTA domain-containing protein [Clostridia bacterium]|nr:PASTA domain-containing protein [Clostridia bacterium]